MLFLFLTISFFLNVYQSPPSSEGIYCKYKPNRLYCNAFKCLKEMILKNHVGFYFLFYD